MLWKGRQRLLLLLQRRENELQDSWILESQNFFSVYSMGVWIQRRDVDVSDAWAVVVMKYDKLACRVRHRN